MKTANDYSINELKALANVKRYKDLEIWAEFARRKKCKNTFGCFFGFEH